MGLSAQYGAARPRPPASDFGVYSVDNVVLERATALNVTCRVHGAAPGLGSWLRVPPLFLDQIPRGYWFVSESEAEESPYGAWALPDAQAFSMARFVLAGFGADQGWREDIHPRYVTDLTGDQRGDIVGFGNDGVWVSLGDGSGGFSAPAYVLAAYAPNQGGWSADRHPRVLADLRGLGRRDIVGFGDAGVWVSLGDGAGGFSAPSYVLAEFGVAQGWLGAQYGRFVVDLTGDGRSDLVGFGPSGVLVALGDGAGGFGPPQLVQTEDLFRYGGQPDYPRTLADLTGDGRPDLVAFGSAGVYTSLNTGNGTFETSREGVHALCVFQGWQADRHPRFVADLTGDGCADIVAFGDQGVQVAHGRGDGTFDPPLPLASFFGRQAMPDLEWQVGRDPRLLADLTGNGAMDVVGFGDDGIWALVMDTTGPRTPQFCVPDLGFNTGWREGTHHRVAADLTGNGRADLVGFGDAGVYVCLNEGAGPVPRPVATQ
jgi:hypothetical protein